MEFKYRKLGLLLGNNRLLVRAVKAYTCPKSTEQNHSCEADSCSASQEILHFSATPTLNFRAKIGKQFIYVEHQLIANE